MKNSQRLNFLMAAIAASASIGQVPGLRPLDSGSTYRRLVKRHGQNPAGSKLIRKAYKARQGHRGTYTEALAFYQSRTG